MPVYTLSRYLIALYHVGQMELTGSGIQLGYRGLWRRLRQSHNAVVSRYNVDALSRDGTDMRGDAQNPKSFQALQM